MAPWGLTAAVGVAAPVREDTQPASAARPCRVEYVTSAYIPLLEVRQRWRGKGVGRELVRRLLSDLEHLYMVDIVCDPDFIPFYERLGMTPLGGMALRNRSALG